MKFALFTFGIPIFALLCVGCSEPNPHAAARTLDEVVTTVNDSLFRVQKQWSKAMAYAVSSGNYSRLKPARLRFERCLDHAARTIKPLENVAGSDEMLTSEMELLTIEKKTVLPAFQPFEKLRVNTPMIEVTLCLDRLKEAGVIEKNALSKFKASQARYEERNGFLFSERALKKIKGDTTVSTQ